MPDRFIEIAEETGTILPIGRWVLREACREAARWLDDGRVPAATFISVNVSAREIQQLGFVERRQGRARRVRPDADRLVLEITETALLKATPATVATLEASGRSASAPSSTTSGPATSRSATCASSRSTPSRSRTSSSRTPTPPRSHPRSPARSWRWAARSASRRSPRGSRRREQADRMRDLGCALGQGYVFARPIAEADLLASSEPPIRRSHRRLRSPVPPLVGPQPRPAGAWLRSRRPPPRGADRRSGGQQAPDLRGDASVYVPACAACKRRPIDQRLTNPARIVRPVQGTGTSRLGGASIVRHAHETGSAWTRGANVCISRKTAASSCVRRKEPAVAGRRAADLASGARAGSPWPGRAGLRRERRPAPR